MLRCITSCYATLHNVVQYEDGWCNTTLSKGEVAM